MIIYLAGRITGDPEYRNKFMEAEAKLKEQGHVVLNPAVLPLGMLYHSYTHIDDAMLECAEAICLLPDWWHSPGARREKFMAEQMEITVMYYEEDLKR